MFRELALSTLMVLATVSIHGLGLHFLRGGIDELARRRPHGALHFSRKGLMVAGLVVGFYALHGLEIWLYAVVYLAIGAVESLREGVYFSTITYGAIGYSDIHIAPDWKLVGAIEGINGVLLLGWSTAFFVTTMVRIRRW
ncbi:MAG: potassium channel family protein [Caulobacteraceae bacterium]|nr:potassium channel family protein [Caulobacteraceae bacterium]